MEHAYMSLSPDATQTYQTTPLHQYAAVNTAVPTVPTAYYPATAKTPTVPVAAQAVNAGLFGMIVVSTGTLGANLNRVGAGEMSMGEAVGNSIANGVKGGIAAATATAAATTLTRGGAAGLAVTVAAATGISYLINKI